jgi:hypothetical protein
MHKYKKYKDSDSLVKMEVNSFSEKPTQKIVTYHQFPPRVIVDSPFEKKSNLSYGIVAFAWNTQRWFLVEKKSTEAFLDILKGNYRGSDLPKLLSSLTIRELELLRNLSEESFNFNHIFKEKFPQSSTEETVYAKERFFANLEEFRKFRTTSKQKYEPDWTFPHDTLRDKRENSVDCAIRSFESYSGIHISYKEKSFFGRDPFTEPIMSTNSQEFDEQSSNNAISSYRYWVVVFMKEKKPKLNGKWVSKEEALSLLPRTRKELLLEVESFIGENFLL